MALQSAEARTRASPAAVVPADSVVPGEVPAVASCPPDDALVEILSRVPVKSLCRFKCVSKAWRDLISYVTESSVPPRNDLYNKKGGYKWLKNGVVEISKVKAAIRNYFTP